jgi:hypothetical protein
MRATEAVEIISNATWRPGIKVNAKAYDPYSSYYDEFYFSRAQGHADSTVIELEIVFVDTYDSSSVNAAGEYTRRANIAPSVTFDVRDMDEDQLLYRVLKWISEAQEHEDREFLRVRRGGRWVAPFHPHNRDGNDLWKNRGRQPRRDYAREMGRL